MSVLRPITGDEYAAWLETVIPEYAADKVASGHFGHNQAAHALYVKLGYVATNINMFKPVARAHA